MTEIEYEVRVTARGELWVELAGIERLAGDAQRELWQDGNAPVSDNVRAIVGAMQEQIARVSELLKRVLREEGRS